MPRNLLAIHGVSGLICAVGDGGKILMWKGGSYEPVAAEFPTKANLTGVWVESPRSAWAVGDRGTVLHWNGKDWLRVTLAYKADQLNAIWGCATDGIWIGGDRRLIQYHGGNGSGGTLQQTDSEIVAIWGSNPGDIFFLCAGRKVMHWNGLGCATMDLPGEEDIEFYGLSGTTHDQEVWACGGGGSLYFCDGEDWIEYGSGTEDTLSGVCAIGEEDLWVVTGGGQLRHWEPEGGWDVAAFSPRGYLSAVCAVDGEIWACGAHGVVIRHRPGLQ